MEFNWAELTGDPGPEIEMSVNLLRGLNRTAFIISRPSTATNRIIVPSLTRSYHEKVSSHCCCPLYLCRRLSIIMSVLGMWVP